MTDQELEAMYARIRMFKRESNMNERVLQRERDEALALSEARNVEMERALRQSRDNSEIALEWQRRYELETIFCKRGMNERDKAKSVLREANAKIAAVRNHTVFHESLADECERGNGGEYAVGRAEGIRDYAQAIHAALSEGESAPTLASALQEARAFHESHPSKSA